MDHLNHSRDQILILYKKKKEKKKGYKMQNIDDIVFT